MPKLEVIDKVKALAEEVAGDNGVELVDVELIGSGRKTILRVTIDKDGGVGMGECQTVSRELESLLDVEDPIVGSYTLEVSSPGIDRPLRNIEDFIRFAGKKARVITRDEIENQTFFVGYIKEVKDDTIHLDLEKKTVSIPYETIKKASLEIEF